MATETFKGTIETAFGKPVSPALSFSGSFEAFDNYQDVPTKDRLSEKDMLAVVNNSLKASARAKKIEETLKAAGYEKPDTSSPEYAKAQLVKTFMKLYNVSEADATALLDAAGSAAAK